MSPMPFKCHLFRESTPFKQMVTIGTSDPTRMFNHYPPLILPNSLPVVYPTTP